MKRISWIIIFLGLKGFLYAQILLPDTKISLPVSISETSGMEWINDSVWVTHNDSGNEPELFFLNEKGELNKKIKLKNTANIDWEDLAFDGTEFLYIADLGNNLNNRKNLKIHRYNLKDSSEKSILLSYGRQVFPTPEKDFNYDSEGIVFFNEYLYAFSKNNTNPYNGICNMYKIHPDDSLQRLIPYDSLVLGEEGYWKNSVTSAGISGDGKKLALLTYKYLYIFYDFPDDRFFKGKQMRFLLPEIQQREAVTFDGNDNIWITDENSRLQNGGYIYYYDMQKVFKAKTFYRQPEIGIVNVKLNKNFMDLHGLENCSFSVSAEITQSGKYTLDILKNGDLFKTYENNWEASDKKIELQYYLGESVSEKNEYAIRIYRELILVYSSVIKL